jgi:Kef-type K+ transport system membrane component KefB
VKPFGFGLSMAFSMRLLLVFFLVFALLFAFLKQIVGVIFGYVAALAFEWAERKKAFDEDSFIAFSIALSLFVLGAGRMAGLDEILSSFVVGNVFSMVVIREQIENIQVKTLHFGGLTPSRGRSIRCSPYLLCSYLA